MLTNKEIVLATRVTSEIQRTVENVATVLGLKPSEYLRRLILDDLEKRSITTTQMEQMKKELWAISIGEEETRQTIISAWEKYNLLLEPHGAVGWAGLEHYIEEKDPNELMVSVETAHPAKFPEEIEELLSFSPSIPKSIAEIEHKKEDYFNIKNNYKVFQKLLIEKFGL